jgi:Holliday junction DNA helicase RuvA
VPGVGKKTAERLVLELRDKVKNISFAEVDEFEDAVAALVQLGYGQKEAQSSIKKIVDKSSKPLPLSELIAAVLKSR